MSSINVWHRRVQYESYDEKCYIEETYLNNAACIYWIVFKDAVKLACGAHCENEHHFNDKTLNLLQQNPGNCLTVSFHIL